MDADRFDRLARSLGTGTTSRRGALRALAGAALGGLLALPGAGGAEAGRRCRRRYRACARNRQCCSRNCAAGWCCPQGETDCCTAPGEACAEGATACCGRAKCARDDADTARCLDCLPAGAFTLCTAEGSPPCCAGLFCNGFGQCVSCLGAGDTTRCNATDRPCCSQLACDQNTRRCCGEVGSVCEPGGCCAGLRCDDVSRECVADE